jgi:hypothetical protein
MKKTLILLVSLVTLSVIGGCRKDAFDGGGSSENKGTSFLRFVGATAAPLNSLFFAPFSDKKRINLGDLRRDVASKSSLNTTATVELIFDQQAITDYNTANHTTFEALPSAIYTLDAPGYVQTPTGYKVTFSPGQVSLPLYVKVDGSLMDLSKKYAVAFKVGAVTGDIKVTKEASENVIMTTIGIKNKYDGVYTLTGNHNRAPYTFPYQTDVELRTLNANTVAVYWPDVANFGHPIGTADGMSWYGTGIGPAFVFDLNTDAVTSAYNIGSATIINLYTTTDGADALANRYNAGTKTLSVSWKYNNNQQRGFFDTFKFKKARN